MRRRPLLSISFCCCLVFAAPLARADAAPSPSAALDGALAEESAAESSLVERALAPNASKKELQAIASRAAALRALRSRLLDARDELDRRVEAHASKADVLAFAASQTPLVTEAATTTEQAMAPLPTSETKATAASTTPAEPAPRPATVERTTAKTETPPPAVATAPKMQGKDAKATASTNPNEPKSLSIRPEPLDVAALEAALEKRDAERTLAAEKEAGAAQSEMQRVRDDAAKRTEARAAKDLELREAASREKWRIVRRTMGYGAIGGGAGAAAVGTIFYGVALGASSSISGGGLATQSDIASAQSRTTTFSTAGVTFVVIGVLVAAGGAALVLTSKPPEHSVLLGEPAAPRKPSAFFAPRLEGGGVVW